MIGRMILPTPVHQILTILVVLLLASVFTIIYSSENGLKDQDISTFGSNTIYGEYVYYMGFDESQREKIEKTMGKVTSRYPYLKEYTIYITNSTISLISVNKVKYL